jgi:hypothetical protein
LILIPKNLHDFISHIGISRTKAFFRSMVVYVKFMYALFLFSLLSSYSLLVHAYAGNLLASNYVSSG